jgi:hypothetical protein
MTKLFMYPHGLINRNNRQIRHQPSPCFVGPIANSKEYNLAKLLGRHLEAFSNKKTLTSDGSIEVNLTRDGTRTVFTGRRLWQTSLFPSRKTGTSIACEGPNELLFAQESEIDPGIAEYATQAVMFNVRVEGKWVRYHCDFCRLRADGAIEIVEVKPNSSHFEQPDYKAKIEAVVELCRLLGWRFRPVFGIGLQQQTFHNFHTSWIHRYRFYKFNQLTIRRISEIVGADLGTMNVGQIVDACANLVEARATISALICQGEIYLDLTKPIYRDTAVTIQMGGML